MQNGHGRMGSEKVKVESKIRRMENHAWETASEKVLVMRAHASRSVDHQKTPEICTELLVSRARATPVPKGGGARGAPCGSRAARRKRLKGNPARKTKKEKPSKPAYSA